MDVMTPSQRHQNMKRIRSADTRAEIMLRKELWHRGLRYRKNWRGLPGMPDVVLTRQKIAIFVDGDFWHARGHQDHPGAQVASGWLTGRRNCSARSRGIKRSMML